MKIKRFLLCCAALCPACLLLRLLQYLTIVDQNGYFVQNGILPQVLSLSVYVLFAVTALLAIITAFSKPKLQADFNVAVGGKGVGYLFIFAAIFIMISSGFYFVSASYDFSLPLTYMQIPHILTIAVAVLGVISAIYYALLGISKISDTQSKSVRMLGIFPPLYFAVFGICEFYSTFDSASQSETKMFMLTVCALALFSMSLTLAQGEAEVYNGRIAAVAGFLAVVTAVTGPAFLLATLFGKVQFSANYVVQAFLHTVFMLIAFTVLVRLTYTKQNTEPDEIEPIEFDPLNKYINEIPDEDRGNDE